MGKMIKIPLLDEVLKGLPDNARLRADVTAYAKRVEELEDEVASLKDDKRRLELENARLEAVVENRESQPVLDDMEIEFLKAISAHDELSAEQLSQAFQVNLQRARFHLERLVKIEVTHGRWNADNTQSFGLTQKGRGYLISKNLL